MRISKKHYVKNIKELRNDGLSVRKIAEMMNTSYWDIYRICQENGFVRRIFKKMNNTFKSWREMNQEDRLEAIAQSEYKWLNRNNNNWLSFRDLSGLMR